MAKKTSLEKRIKNIYASNVPSFLKAMQTALETAQYLDGAKYLLTDVKGIEALVITNPAYNGKFSLSMNRPSFKNVNDYHFSHDKNTGEIDVGFQLFSVFPFVLNFVPDDPKKKIFDRQYSLHHGVIAGFAATGATLVSTYNGLKSLLKYLSP